MAQKKWIVEEQDSAGKVTYKQEFTDHDEAISMYKYLKESHDDTNVSIEPVRSKLILG